MDVAGIRQVSVVAHVTADIGDRGTNLWDRTGPFAYEGCGVLEYNYEGLRASALDRSTRLELQCAYE